MHSNRSIWRAALRNPSITVGGGILLLITLLFVFAPWLGTVDPLTMNPIARTLEPSAKHWFGTDTYGRDLYSRVLYGGRISLLIGFSVAILATVIGLLIGLVSGYFRIVDMVVMRIMDGLMSIPAVLLAIAMTALMRGSVLNVIIAITVSEIPRVVRLVRGSVLSLRERTYVEAAMVSGTRTPTIIVRHILPNTFAPLVVQATYIFAAAMIMEAIMSFIGAGTPPSIPSWGNIIAEGRMLWQVKFMIIVFPAVFLSIAVFSINMMGDGLRDLLDPKAPR
ncbi:ABC transporter permease [Arvimicrobium flavum]|uniref:ABC transporter permease n=1 Tax=Arvimicrobium flavum TaxID=3393320 RepID=UPI00237B7D7A|nr:ABC transporter permease [Mesorhizobium shangrilense]